MHKKININKKLHFFIFLLISLLITIPTKKSEAASEWRYEGIAYYVPGSSAETRPVYRFYSPMHKAHFFTISSSEKDKIISTYPSNEWRYEGIAFYVPINYEGNKPAYRFYSPKYKTHFFTISSSEKDNIISTYPKTEWRYEGVAYYVPTIIENNRPLYRFYNKVNKAHFFTTSETEKDRLLTPLLGPQISIGLWSLTKSESQDDPIRIESTNYSYKIKNEQGKVYATVPPNSITEIEYKTDGTLRVHNSIDDIIVNREVIFEAADDANKNNIIFDVHRPNSSYDEYRTKVRVRYSDTTKKIWTINELPLEQYAWGMGEITGTGPMEYNKMMTSVYRTYGYWKILYSTKYATEGFDVDATPGNQIYRGYEWEQAYPRIKEGAEATRGKIVKHGSDIALTPYSSWTDGKTRSFEERWGSTLYPWCQSVSDPYGDYNGGYWENSYKSTADLVAEGNHMVGISAHGALTLANDKGWDWQKIINYYLDDISIISEY